MQTFTVWGLDVWGHGPDEHEKYECDGNCDGYTVNDRFKIGRINVDDDDEKGPLDDRIVSVLCELEWLRHDAVTVDGDDGLLFVERESDGKPLLQLERAE
jgi:hypothetical protein